MKGYITSGLILPTSLIKKIPLLMTFSSKLKNSIPLDKEFDDYQKLLNTGITDDQAIKNMSSKPNHLRGWKTATT